MKKNKIDTPNPLEKLLFEIKVGFQNLFPLTNEFLADFTFDSPPSHIEADYSFSTFFLGAVLKQNPSAIASQIIKYFTQTSPSLVKRMFAVGPYINVEVDQPSYYQKTLEHISHLGKKFGTSHRRDSKLIFIVTLNNLRFMMIGQVIGKCYGNNGDVVQIFHQKTESQSVPDGRQVIADALAQNIAEHISNTQAIATLPFGNAPPLLLQKNNGSTTSIVRYLSYLKYYLSSAQPTSLIYLSPQTQADTVKDLLVLASRLGYISSQIKVSLVTINHMDESESLIETNQASRYAILRTPLDKEVIFNFESLAHYSRLERIINQLKAGPQATGLSDNDKFKVAKSLLAFPRIITEIQNSNKPDRLCAYLEEVADMCDKLSVSRDKDLSKVAIITIENGLKLLTP